MPSSKKHIPLWLMVCVAFMLIYVGNPAIALIVGAGIAIMSNRSTTLPDVGNYALQFAIIMLGFQLDISQVSSIANQYTGLICGYVIVTLALGLMIGFCLRQDVKLNALISCGTAICGGTTIAAMSPLIKARAEQMGTTLAFVFIMNLFAMLSFPLIGEWFALSQEQFGLWVALAIHDTSSVVVTAAIYGEESLYVATTVKLLRTLGLVPLLLILSFFQVSAPTDGVKSPLFILGFLLVICVNSFFPVPVPFRTFSSHLSEALLVIALFFIGTEISKEVLSSMKFRLIVHGLLLWGIVAGGLFFYVRNFV